jgi:AcrR family transcriptional regulator
MNDSGPEHSPRHGELLERAYRYSLDHGLTDLSLRPLAEAIESSPRVLLYLFGSKEGLLRALLARARADELALLDQIRVNGENHDLPTVVRATWQWLSDDAHRPLLILWAEAYTRSLSEPDGPWSQFARQTIEDWLAVLASAQPPARRRSRRGSAERTLALSVLRGALLDLLATRDIERTTTAVLQHLENMRLEP